MHKGSNMDNATVEQPITNNPVKALVDLEMTLARQSTLGDMLRVFRATLCRTEWAEFTPIDWKNWSPQPATHGHAHVSSLMDTEPVFSIRHAQWSKPYAANRLQEPDMTPALADLRGMLRDDDRHAPCLIWLWSLVHDQGWWADAFDWCLPLQEVLRDPDALTASNHAESSCGAGLNDTGAAKALKLLVTDLGAPAIMNHRLRHDSKASVTDRHRWVTAALFMI